MKTFKSILIIIVVLAITVTFFRITEKGIRPIPTVPNQNAADVTSSIDTSPNVNAEQLCYIWNTEAGDKAQLGIDMRGNQVTGEFNWLPAEKDKKTGIFNGTIGPLDNDPQSRIVNAIWNTNAEGMQVPEELNIKLSAGIANPGFGEMKDRGDGTYIYADPSKIDYSLNLSQTDCGDSAMD